MKKKKYTQNCIKNLFPFLHSFVDVVVVVVDIIVNGI